ncbi:thioesterase family protein [Leekyejoonella antrihumi]|uniref:Thioesterase family protein n=1 Tax=Leekyejoonella antrihumi TaxID=1660198 RepID=A0A563DXE2_9MICO|nr:thioesterase family protein [Leekyejoonella antrihumi]TWP34875.1 thioesterase family protein [Leekyejoonella antrihumi]
MTEYDEAIKLTGPDDQGRYTGTLSDDWAIGGAVNGGLLMSLATAATAACSTSADGHADPLTYSGVFLSPGTAGEITAYPQILRTGRSMTTAEVRTTQRVDGIEVERSRALLTLGDLDRYAEPVLKSEPAPDMPGPEDCPSAADAPPTPLTGSGFLKRFDLRLDPATVGWAIGRPSGKGEMRGWLKLADERDFDATSLLMALDAFPPVSFDLGSQGWVPTVEFTGYVRAVPAPGWLCMRLSTSTVTGGLLEEDAQIWDSTGRLVAHSRQLASARFPS